MQQVNKQVSKFVHIIWKTLSLGAAAVSDQTGHI